MPRKAWLAIYLADFLFWLWVVHWRGAQRLAGSCSAGFLLKFRASIWDFAGIKLFGWLMLIISTIWFVVGIFLPEMRWF